MELINKPFGFLHELHLPVIIKCLLLAALALLFLQSGIDKVTQRKGNLEWLTGYFAKSPLRNMVPFLLFTVTVLELASGLASAFAIIVIATKPAQGFIVGQFAGTLSLLTLVCLFTGQRLAKDYPAAASMIGYMIFAGLTALVM